MMPRRDRVLVVDDKPNFLKLFQEILGSEFDVTTAEDGNRALALLEAGSFDVVVSDIRMPGLDGISLMKAVKQRQPEVEVILVTAYGAIPKAVEAMKEGAYHYLTKPFEPDEVLILVQRAAERKRLRRQAEDRQQALADTAGFGNLLAKSRAMRKVFNLLSRAAQSDATVLVTGQSGTGKELVARALHAESRRKSAPFIAVNCGAIPETLIESELFGHAKGAFTGALIAKRGLFEEAHEGTIFLDEIGDLPLPMQVKLTRVLQERAVRRVGEHNERPVDVRVMAATHVDLEKAVEEGGFREDLYYRLNVFPIHLPPLRDRRDDIPLLIAILLDRHLSRAISSQVEGVTADAMTALSSHDWPGNVRQLENALERALAVCEGTRIGLEDLPESVRQSPANSEGPDMTHLEFKEVVSIARDRASRDYLLALMRKFQGNVTQASEQAGIERESLHRLLRKHGIRSHEFREVQ